MESHRSGAWALIAGSILTVAVFALHPSHVFAEPILGPFTLSQLVHGAALLAVPLLAFGMWQMGEWLGFGRTPVRLALVLAFLAMVLTANAAVFSNFVTPAAAEATRTAMQSAHPVRRQGATQSPHHGQSIAASPLIRTSVAANRGYAQVHVGYWSLALLLFGLALRGRSDVVAWIGVAVGVGPLIWQLSGTFSPETATMPLIAFPQSAWLIAVALVMLRSRSPEAE